MPKNSALSLLSIVKSFFSLLAAEMIQKIPNETFFCNQPIHQSGLTSMKINDIGCYWPTFELSSSAIVCLQELGCLLCMFHNINETK